MPSMAHEVLVDLIKNRPSLAAEILREILGSDLPDHDEARLPSVLRREAVPVVTDVAEAARRLELGMLSVMAHGETELGMAIATTLLPVIAGLDEEQARFYLDL